MSLAPPEAEPTLPKFVPTTMLVQAHSRALVGAAYDDLSGLEQFHLGQKSMQVLTAIGDELLAAALDHVTTHAPAFGFDQHLAEQIMFARMAGPIAAVEAEGGDVEADPILPDVPEPPD